MTTVAHTVRTWEQRSGIRMPLPLGSLWAPWDSNPQPTDYKSGSLQGKAWLIIICRFSHILKGNCGSSKAVLDHLLGWFCGVSYA
jgi:hypothetical protein